MQTSVIFGILIKLLNHGKLTAHELSEEFEVSKRTIYRYIDTLCASGVPIFCTSGKNGGIEILKDYKLTSSYFSKEEKDFLISTLKNENNNKMCSDITEKLINLNK